MNAQNSQISNKSHHRQAGSHIKGTTGNRVLDRQRFQVLLILFLHAVQNLPTMREPIKHNHTNYRGIALSSLYGKLFDNVVLMYYLDKLTTSELQCGFKAKSSTSTFVLKESLVYYVNNNSPVYCTFLYATKAFDRVNCSKLSSLTVF